MSELDRLCARCGVELDYSDLWGNRRNASDATKLRVLRALGVVLDSAASAGAALAELENAAWHTILPPVKVVRAGTPPELDLVLPAERLGSEHRWMLELEDGQRAIGTLRPDGLPVVARAEIRGKMLFRVNFRLPGDLPHGYHRYTLSEGGMPAGTTQLIVCPGRCYQPAALGDSGRVWGPAVQLYALRSERNWGIG